MGNVDSVWSILLFFFFLIFLADTYTCPILGPLIPLFWISGDVSSGFQSQSGLPYSHCGGERNVRSLRSTSGATRCRPLDGKHCGAPVYTSFYLYVFSSFVSIFQFYQQQVAGGGANNIKYKPLYLVTFFFYD